MGIGSGEWRACGTGGSRLAYLVTLVWLVCLVGRTGYLQTPERLERPDEPNRPDRRDQRKRPDQADRLVASRISRVLPRPSEACHVNGRFVGFFLFTAPASAEFGFDEKYERDHTIFNPINQYRAGNLLNPINAYATHFLDVRDF